MSYCDCDYTFKDPEVLLDAAKVELEIKKAKALLLPNDQIVNGIFRVEFITGNRCGDWFTMDANGKLNPPIDRLIQSVTKEMSKVVKVSVDIQKGVATIAAPEIQKQSKTLIATSS